MKIRDVARGHQKNTENRKLEKEEKAWWAMNTRERGLCTENHIAGFTAVRLLKSSADKKRPDLRQLMDLS